MLAIETKGNPDHPLVTVFSNAIDEIYGTLTAIPTERLENLFISNDDETVIVAEIKSGEETKSLNVYLDTPQDAKRLIAFLQN